MDWRLSVTVGDRQAWSNPLCALSKRIGRGGQRINIIETELPGVLIIEPRVIGDERGYFLEAFNKKAFEEAGLPIDWLQDNVSLSRKGVLRGLHMQHPTDQIKLVSAAVGEIFDVAVDLRSDSPTFRKWFGTNLSDKNCRQLLIPEGFAHGFAVLSDKALVTYKASAFYSQPDEISIAWNDPEIGIEWPFESPIQSEKDSKAPLLADFDPKSLPIMSQLDPNPTNV